MLAVHSRVCASLLQRGRLDLHIKPLRLSQYLRLEPSSLRVGPGANPSDYVVAPNTSDELLEIRVQRLRELPSGIGHDELLRRVGPPDAD